MFNTQSCASSINLPPSQNIPLTSTTLIDSLVTEFGGSTPLITKPKPVQSTPHPHSYPLHYPAIHASGFEVSFDALTKTKNIK